MAVRLAILENTAVMVVPILIPNRIGNPDEIGISPWDANANSTPEDATALRTAVIANPANMPKN